MTRAELEAVVEFVLTHKPDFHPRFKWMKIASEEAFNPPPQEPHTSILDPFHRYTLWMTLRKCDPPTNRPMKEGFKILAAEHFEKEGLIKTRKKRTKKQEQEEYSLEV